MKVLICEQEGLCSVTNLLHFGKRLFGNVFKTLTDHSANMVVSQIIYNGFAITPAVYQFGLFQNPKLM
jgi:hypothetical protein